MNVKCFLWTETLKKYVDPEVFHKNKLNGTSNTNLKNYTLQILEKLMIESLSMKTPRQLLVFIWITGFKVRPFELNHGRKPKTVLTTIITSRKRYQSDWTKLDSSVALCLEMPKQKSPRIPLWLRKASCFGFRYENSWREN